MTFRIYFTVGEHDDSFVVSGETVQDIQNIAAAELSKRRLDAKRNDCWSKEMNE